jgi:hypothetical protein
MAVESDYGVVTLTVSKWKTALFEPPPDVSP